MKIHAILTQVLHQDGRTHAAICRTNSHWIYDCQQMQIAYAKMASHLKLRSNKQNL